MGVLKKKVERKAKKVNWMQVLRRKKILKNQYMSSRISLKMSKHAGKFLQKKLFVKFFTKTGGNIEGKLVFEKVPNLIRLI